MVEFFKKGCGVLKFKKNVLDNHKNGYKKKKKRNYIFVGTIIVAIWLGLLLVKIKTATESGETIAQIRDTILSGIFDNILGILPPVIFIDLLLDYFQQDKVLDEMTEQITGTIMSKPEVIQSFNKDAQKRFLNATVLSLVDQDSDECSMAMGAIEPYIEDRFDIRKDFVYYLEIRDCENIDGFDSDKYMMMCENLSYELFYIASKPIRDKVRIGFFVENSDLDKGLREEKVEYIIREGLNIDPIDFEHLTNIVSSSQDLSDYINKLLSPRLYIDDEMWLISDVLINDNSIDVEFRAPKCYNSNNNIKKSNKISIYFHMPQLKAHTSFLASISQPTYSPIIRLSYPEEKYNITNYLFFNKTFGPSAEKAQQGIGCRNIQIKNKWVHPMSGVVFFIEHK